MSGPFRHAVRREAALVAMFLCAGAPSARAATPFAMEDTKSVGAKRIRVGLGAEYLFKEYQGLEASDLVGGSRVQPPDYKHKLTLAQIDLGFGVGPDAEIQFAGSGLALMVPGSDPNSVEKKWKGGPADLIVGFKWRFLSLVRREAAGQSESLVGPQPGGEFAGAASAGDAKLPPHAAVAFYARTKLPNASEKKLLGTNNTDFEFGFLGDYGLLAPFSLHASLGMNIVGDPRRPNWQDDLVTYRMAAKVRDGKALGAPWLPAVVSFGFQGFAGYYKRSDRKQRVFLQLGDAAKWWGGDFELVLSRQVFGDKADRFELFNLTENFGVALRGTRIL